MAAAANLVLLNAAAASVTFTPYSVEPDWVEWTENGATSILGTTRLRLGRSIPKDRAMGIYRIYYRLTRPVINATTGAVRTVSINVEVLRPADMVNTDVTEAQARMAHAIDGTAGYLLWNTAAMTGAIPT